MYYTEWIFNGHMFGRETSDHFVDLGPQRLGHEMESWADMKNKAGHFNLEFADGWEKYYFQL